MKKVIYCLIFSLFCVFPFTALAAGNQEMTGAVNEQFKKSLTYYKDHSAQILDSITTSTEVGEGGAKQVKNIKVVLAEGKEVRDSIFYFDTKQIYYYDLDAQKIIDAGTVQKNTEIKKFEKKYKNEVGKDINPFSLLIFMIALFSTIILPLIFAALSNKNSSSYKLQLEQVSVGTYKN
ncbi:hypothetical protein [Anoxybacteroides tepidamans]|uniref:hypothetical protein n=1 Tax=Anoxybacteroides tepidamans TaxID=265948 RepID=UPI000683D6BE|nr:hypothetical protein [Anoxybacillus tepidamans]